MTFKIVARRALRAEFDRRTNRLLYMNLQVDEREGENIHMNII